MLFHFPREEWNHNRVRLLSTRATAVFRCLDFLMVGTGKKHGNFRYLIPAKKENLVFSW